MADPVAKFDLDKFLSIVSILGPAILMVVPGGAQIAVLIPKIVSAIQEAEALPNSTGPEKKAHVLKIVDAAVAVLNATGRVVLDPAQIQAIAGSAIDLVISIVNVIEGSRVVTKPV